MNESSKLISKLQEELIRKNIQITRQEKRIAELENLLIELYDYGNIDRSDIENLIPKLKGGAE
jgi:uncharacterized coiled-coil protein SlyX